MNEGKMFGQENNIEEKKDEKKSGLGNKIAKMFAIGAAATLGAVATKEMSERIGEYVGSGEHEQTLKEIEQNKQEAEVFQHEPFEQKGGIRKRNDGVEYVLFHNDKFHFKNYPIVNKEVIEYIKSHPDEKFSIRFGIGEGDSINYEALCDSDGKHVVKFHLDLSNHDAEMIKILEKEMAEENK